MKMQSMFGNQCSRFGGMGAGEEAAGGVGGSPPRVPSPRGLRRDSVVSGLSEVTSSYGSAVSSAFTHDPYSWGEVKRAVSRSSSVSSEGVSGRGSSCSSVGSVVSEGSSYPVTTHTLVRCHTNQRFGAWIRGNSITNVVEEGPAAIAGLQVGMRVMAVDGISSDPSTVSALIRKTWKETGHVTLLVEARPPGTRSKRSMAKARSRQRAREAAAGTASAEELCDDEE